MTSPTNTNLIGSLVALITPMFPDSSLDIETYKKLIDWHIEQGTKGLVVVGTSGESPTVNVDEHAQLISIAVEHSAGRIPIVAGVGGNSTTEAISLSQHALKVGANAGLSVVPYYNKPTQQGMYEHFRAIAEKVELPSLLYNVPGRTVADLSNETIVRLSEIPNIIGVKDATGNIASGSRLLRDVPKGFLVLSGDDATAAALMLLGGHGNISVTANIAPKLMSQLCDAAISGDVVLTRQLNAKLAEINHVLFIEANPIPVKWAAAEMGLTALGYRLPLTKLSVEHHATVRNSLQKLGLI